VVPETNGVKLMKGFTLQLGRKGTDVVITVEDPENFFELPEMLT
jgi:predicted glycosyltransferase